MMAMMQGGWMTGRETGYMGGWHGIRMILIAILVIVGIIAVIPMNPTAVKSVVGHGVQAATSIDELVAKLAKPRAVWVMVPARVAGKEHLHAQHA